MSSEDQNLNLTVAQPQTTAASADSTAVATSSQPLGTNSLVAQPQSTTVTSPPLGSVLSLGQPGSPPLGSDLSLGQPGSPPPVALPQTTAVSSSLGSFPFLALPKTTAASSSLGSFPFLAKTTAASSSLGSFPSLALSQTTAASAASPAIATRSQKAPKALNFPFTKITIGDWTQATASSGDLMAKCYFGKRQLVWELLVEVQRESKNTKLKKKMEIQWASILSLKASQGILEVELREPPKFFIQTDDPMSSYNWEPIEYFTQNHPSSIYRRHKLHFDPQVLEKNYDVIVTGDSFWSTLAPYPSLQESTFYGVATMNALGREFQALIIDCKEVFDLMMKKTINFGATNWVCEARFWMYKFDECQFKWVARDFNKPADILRINDIYNENNKRRSISSNGGHSQRLA